MTKQEKNGKHSKINPLELELNELRSRVAQLQTKEAAEIKAKLEALEAEMRAKADAGDEGEQARAAILAALEKAGPGGKPGHLAFPQFETLLNMTRSAVHYHTNALEKERKIWIRKTHDPKSGRPVFFAYHPSSLREVR